MKQGWATREGMNVPNEVMNAVKLLGEDLKQNPIGLVKQQQGQKTSSYVQTGFCQVLNEGGTKLAMGKCSWGTCIFRATPAAHSMMS